MEQAEFDSAAIWSYCQQVLDSLDATEEDAGASEVPARDRLRWLASMVLGHRKDDPRNYSLGLLQHVEPSWGQVVNHLASHTRGSAGLGNAVAQAEASLVPFGAWPAQAQRGGAAALATRTFDAYSESAKDSREKLVGRIGELENELIEADKARRAEAEQSQAVLDELAASLTRERERMEQLESQMTTALKENTAAFLKAQAERGDNFSEWLDEQADTLLDQAQPGLDRTAGVRDEAETILAALTKLRDETEGMAGEAAGAVLARDFGQAAEKDRKAGLKAYGVGFAILTAVAVYLGVSLYSVGSGQNELSWEYLAVRLVLSATGGAAAAIAFTRGSSFYGNAEDNKNRELELRAIGPFLSGIAPEQADQARLDFVSRTFGVPKSVPNPKCDKVKEDEAPASA